MTLSNTLQDNDKGRKNPRWMGQKWGDILPNAPKGGLCPGLGLRSKRVTPVRPHGAWKRCQLRNFKYFSRADCMFPFPCPGLYQAHGVAGGAVQFPSAPRSLLLPNTAKPPFWGNTGHCTDSPDSRLAPTPSEGDRRETETLGTGERDVYCHQWNNQAALVSANLLHISAAETKILRWVLLPAWQSSQSGKTGEAL